MKKGYKVKADLFDGDIPLGMTSHGSYAQNYARGGKLLNKKIKVKAIAPNAGAADKLAHHAKKAGVSVVSVAQEGGKIVLELAGLAVAVMSVINVFRAIKGFSFIKKAANIVASESDTLSITAGLASTVKTTVKTALKSKGAVAKKAGKMKARGTKAWEDAGARNAKIDKAAGRANQQIDNARAKVAGTAAGVSAVGAVVKPKKKAQVVVASDILSITAGLTSLGKSVKRTVKVALKSTGDVSKKASKAKDRAYEAEKAARIKDKKKGLRLEQWVTNDLNRSRRNSSRISRAEFADKAKIYGARAKVAGTAVATAYGANKVRKRNK